MKRRRFTQHTAAAAMATVAAPWWATTAVQAQAPAAGFTEGTHYMRLSQPLPATGGRIEVVEFFWYGCPHCNAFEPALDAWAKKLPTDVVVRRMPVAFRDNPFTAHQKIYFALEALNKVDAAHRRVFSAIHVERQKLDQPAEIAALMVKAGINEKAFMDAYNSFGVQSKVQQAKKLAEGYKVDGVPALGIGGRFYTSPPMAGSPERALAAADFLIQRVRKGA
jgi:protein dithiol oxidoreductase (disulfide-forming)